MSAAVLVAAAGAGLLSSIHCAAMCGPLAIAGCGRAGRVDARVAIGYFAGRLVSYATVGAVLGRLGAHALCLLPMGAIEAVALALVAAGAAARGLTLLSRRTGSGSDEPLVQLRTPRAGARGGRSGALSRLLAEIGHLFPSRGAPLGLATGVLPCGALASGWALAAGSASPLTGAAAMAIFALASAPGLVVAIVGRAAASRALARVSVRAQAAAWLTLAAWLAVRPVLAGARACHLL